MREKIDALLPELIDIRHMLHSNPEAQLKEYDTAELIRARLKAEGIETAEPLLGTEVQ